MKPDIFTGLDKHLEIRVNHDLHVHTYLSSCCAEKDNQTPEKILAMAEEMGLDTIGFSDHIWTNAQLETSDWYRAQDERQITRLWGDLSSAPTSLRVLVGCEADTIAPGKFSITPKFAASLDFVGLSCSHFHMKELVQQPADNTPRSIGKHMVKFFVSAAGSGLATVIVHPFKPKGYEKRYDDAIAALSDSELLDALSVAAEFGVAVEISTAFLPTTDKSGASSWSIETPLRIPSLAKIAGCKFCFGSDAHTLGALRQLAKLDIFNQYLDLSEDDLASIVRREIG